MTRQYKLILYLILLIPSYLLAAEKQIITLEIRNVCQFNLAYQDKGSDGDKDIAIYTPRVPNDFFMIGGYAQGNYDNPNQCVVTVRPDSQSSPLLIAPANWRLVWADKGSGAHMDGSIWQPVSSNPDYLCIGSVGQTGYRVPNITNYRCLHKCLLQTVNVPAYIWSDRGTNADKPVSMYKLASSNSFIARSDRNAPSLMLDILPVLACTSDLQPVSDTSAPDRPVQSAPPSLPPAPPPPQVRPKSNEWVNPDEVHQKRPSSRPPNSEWVNPDNL